MRISDWSSDVCSSDLYPQELVDIEDYNIPEGARGDYRITAKELQFSEQLIETMSGDWEPEQYQDEFRERLHQVIEKRMKAKGVVEREHEDADLHEDASRSEEHTSELQSLMRISYAVFCLKKKKKN